MTKAPSTGRARPRILYSQTPHSISRRAKALPRTAGELLRHLCELTIGFGKGSVDLTYSTLAEALGRNWSTIARAVMVLRKNGDVFAEPLRDGSYRWSVILEPEDIVSDPMGLYRVRTTSADGATHDPHGKNAMTPMAKTPCPHGKNAIPPMAKTPWGHDLVDNSAIPCPERPQARSKQVEKEALKIIFKDTCSKIHQQKTDKPTKTSRDDDESPNHKKLFQDLVAIGTGQRIARKLLRKHEHSKIAQALKHVRQRKDLKNPAGYLICEIEDGGYEEIAPASKEHVTFRGENTPEAVSSSHLAAQQTRSEMEQLEQERREKDAAYREELKRLLERFANLPQNLKLDLKARWTAHMEQLVPNTARKAEILKEPRFERLAFKEVASTFFDLLDQGCDAHQALERLAA